MQAHRDAHISRGTALLAFLFACALSVVGAASGVAQTATPAPSGPPGPLRLTARPLMGGNVRAGSWLGVRVHLENDGPAVSGELRLTGGAQQGSRYSTEVELPTGARQDHLLYTQPTWSGGRVDVSLVSGEATLLDQRVQLTAIDPYTTTVVIVAERPDAVAPAVRGAVTNPNQATRVLTVEPEDLPPRAEAWAVIDRLVWQDVDPARLSPEQLDALTTWVGAGGRLVVVGGQNGIAGVSGLPEGLLPYVPSSTIDAPADDVAALVGDLPAGTDPVPALTGDLVRGTVVAWSDGRPIAAQASVGQGQVSLVGIDPTLTTIASAPGAEALWRRTLGPLNGQALNPLVLQDDSQIVAALNTLPAVALPDLGLLFGLLAVYIVLIGPINYLILRRIDRREWAWVTMPVLVLVFGVGTYVVGMGLKGTDVIIDQLAIVRAAAGSDRGLAQTYVGIFSPSRQTFDVAVGGEALLANPSYLAQSGSGGTPIDVLAGEASRLRGYEVGFGVLRAFRAEAQVETPRVDADLTYVDGVLEGTLTNRSDETLESVAVTWGGQATVLPVLAPGATADVRLDLGTRTVRTDRLATMVIPGQVPGDQTAYVRQTILDQVSGYRNTLGTGGLQANPVVIAFRPGPTLPITTGATVRQEGDTLYLMPAAVRPDGTVVATDPLITRSTLELHANDVWDDGSSWSLGTGWITAELRPVVPLDGSRATYLGIAFSQDMGRLLTGRGLAVDPLPPDQQPDQDDPLQVPTPPDPNAAPRAVNVQLPAYQLLDRTTGRWVEFPAATNGVEIRIPDPARYLDESGAFRIRFVNRVPNSGLYFSIAARMEAESA